MQPTKPLSRLGAVLCLALLVSVTACGNDDDAGEDGTGSDGQDRGVCTEEVLPASAAEVGDAPDEGALAQCGFKGGGCEEADFDLSRCDTASLGTLERNSTFNVHRRYVLSGERVVSEDTALRLVENAAGPYTLGGRELQVKKVESGAFFVRTRYSGTLRFSDGSTAPVDVQVAFAGCSATPTELRGCARTCRSAPAANFRDALNSTFQAVRVSENACREEVAEGLELLAEAGTPAQPTHTAADVYVTKGHAYLVTLNAGLQVFDLADPRAPRRTTEILGGQDAYWNAVWAKGDALYVASNRSGVRVYDITDPAQPVFLRALPGTPLDVHTLHVDGNLLAAADTDTPSVMLFDVTDPKNPVLRGRYQSPTPQLTSDFHDMRLFEGKLYVNAWEGGLEVADVADPANPRFLGVYRYPAAKSHAVVVRRYGERTIAFEGGEKWDAHLRVLDVTNPAAIRLLAQYRRARHVSIHNLELVGDRLYIAYYQEGVRVLDVSVPETPREVGHYRTWRRDDPDRGSSFYDGAIGIRADAGDGRVYAVDTSRGLLVLQPK